MGQTYDVLAADGSVLQYREDQFSEFTEARSREDRERLVGEGWTPLDERIEVGEMPPHKSAVKEAFLETVVPPEPAPHVTVFILGKLKPGEDGVKVV
jgi:hypothetical protein